MRTHQTKNASAAPLLVSSRLLVIAPNWIGDAVMAQPLLALLKQQLPNCSIDVLAPSWVAPVLRAMPEVDTVIEAPFKHGALQLGERWKFAQQLRERHYAAAYVLPNTLKFALVPWLAGIKRRIGYKGEHRYGLINYMHFDDPMQPRAMVAFYAAMASAPNAPLLKNLPMPTLHLEVAKVQAALATLGIDSDQTIVAFAPGAEFGTAKRWPTQHFAALAESILQLKPQAKILLMGSHKDVAVCEEIRTLCADGVRANVLQLAGQTSLDQAIALLAGANVLVSNDSGLMHIASALNRPVIALYGPTDPDHAPPFSASSVVLSLRLNCAPCKQRDCPLGHHACMRDMTSELVWQPLQTLLK